jgi:hypothetical protein
VIVVDCWTDDHHAEDNDLRRAGHGMRAHALPVARSAAQGRGLGRADPLPGRRSGCCTPRQLRPDNDTTRTDPRRWFAVFSERQDDAPASRPEPFARVVPQRAGVDADQTVVVEGRRVPAAGSCPADRAR